MNTDPSGKICLVTGAATGLARAMAVGLAEAGAHVVACDIDEDGLLDTIELARTGQARGKIVAQTTDVQDRRACEVAVRETINEFGRLDVLVNCAGLGPYYMRTARPADTLPFWEADPDRWWTVLRVNVRGPFLLSRAVVPGMIERGWGRIVNITTSYSTMMRGGNTPYGQTKAALEAGTASWAEDLAGTGVTANVLIPGGAADTHMVPVEAVGDRASLIPPSVMVAPIRYLASPASDGVTSRRFIGQLFNEIEPLSAPGCAPVAWPDLAAGHASVTR